jgi:hypothetical protein
MTRKEMFEYKSKLKISKKGSNRESKAEAEGPRS